MADMTQSPYGPQQQPGYGQSQPSYGQQQQPPSSGQPQAPPAYGQEQPGVPGYPSAPPSQYQSPAEYGSQYQPYSGGDNYTVGGDPTLAEWWRRLLGYIIDGIVLGIVYAILNAIISPKGLGATYLMLLILCVIAFAYYTAQHAAWGQTLGKRALGTFVVTADTRGKISGSTAAIRGAVFALPPIVYFIGSLFVLVEVLWLTWDPRRQALHDKAAKTLVVKKESLQVNPYQQGAGYSGQQPGGYPGQQPGGYPGQQPGGYPGQQPGGYPGQQPGGYPGQQ